MEKGIIFILALAIAGLSVVLIRIALKFVAFIGKAIVHEYYSFNIHKELVITFILVAIIVLGFLI